MNSAGWAEQVAHSITASRAADASLTADSASVSSCGGLRGGGGGESAMEFGVKAVPPWEIGRRKSPSRNPNTNEGAPKGMRGSYGGRDIEARRLLYAYHVSNKKKSRVFIHGAEATATGKLRFN